MLTSASVRYTTYAEARADGWSRARIDSAVRAGQLVRVRRGRYVEGGTDGDVLAAARWGGRLDCVSLLRLYGIFVLHHARLHLQLTPGASRLPPRPPSVVAHWRQTAVATEALLAAPVEALAQACLCQNLRAAIASLDSAWHLGLVDEEGIGAVFARLPRRYLRIRKLLDPRSESGPESLVRLMLRSLGCRVEVQPTVRGVGRVDFIVDGWLIVECDSRGFHSDWESQRRDRRRDRLAAEQGYPTLRLIAEEILYQPEKVMTCLRGIIAAHNSSRSRR